MPFAGMGHFAGITMDLIALCLAYIIFSKIFTYYEDEFDSVYSHNCKVHQYHEDVEEFEEASDYSGLSEEYAPEWDVRKDGNCRYWLVDSKAFAAHEFAKFCWLSVTIYLTGCIICHIIAIIF